MTKQPRSTRNTLKPALATGVCSLLITGMVGAALASSASANAPANAVAATSGRTEVAISMGDSFISGEGGRFAGSIYGTPTNDGAVDGGPHNRGDIYQSIVGDKTFKKGEFPSNEACHRSDSAEIRVAAKSLGYTPMNLACSGAVTKNFDDVKQRDYENTQLTNLQKIASDRENYDIKLIAVSIGGNDLKFADLLTDATQITARHDAEKEGLWRDGGQSLLPTVKKRVTNTLDNITQIMRANGYKDGSYRFTYQGYPNIFSSSKERHRAGSWPMASWWKEGIGVPLSDATVDYSRRIIVPEINQTLRDAAADSINGKIQFMNIQNLFAGHELSNSNTQLVFTNIFNQKTPAQNTAEWVVPINSNYIGGSVFNTSRQNESFHPNYFGQLALGECLTATTHMNKQEVTCTGKEKSGSILVTESGRTIY